MTLQITNDEAKEIWFRLIELAYEYNFRVQNAQDDGLSTLASKLARHREEIRSLSNVLINFEQPSGNN